MEIFRHLSSLKYILGFVQRTWSSGELVDDPSINLLETRAARESVLALVEPGDRVKAPHCQQDCCRFFQTSGRF